MQKERDVSNNEETKNDSYDLLVSDHRKQQLKKRFDEQSYCTQNHWLRRLCQYFSITKHGTSIVMGFMGAWYFLSTFIHFVIAGFIAFIALALIEYTQRRSSDGFWDKFFQSHQTNINWGLLALSIICVGANGVITGYGYYQTTLRQSNNAPIITNDSTLLALQSQLAVIDGEILAARNTKWKGTTTVDAQRTIKQYSKTQNELTTAILARNEYLQNKNDGIESTHKLSIENIAWVAFIICLIVELLFEASMAYASYYDHRLYIELGLHSYVNDDNEIDDDEYEQTGNNRPIQDGFQNDIKMPTYDLDSPEIKNQRTIVGGFKQGNNLFYQAKQHNANLIKTVETAQAKHPETAVPQPFQTKTAKVKQETETIEFRTVSEKYIRQKFFTAFKRKNTQLDPTTPTRNFKKEGEMLEKLGYQYEERGKGDGAVLILKKGEEQWVKTIKIA